MANKKISELVAATVPLAGDELLEIVQGGTNKKIPVLSLSRITLTADTTFYVATTGNDGTGDGSVGNPWLTVTYAWNTIRDLYDCMGFIPTIQMAAGTYTENIDIFYPLVGAPYGQIVGTIGTPTDVHSNASSYGLNARFKAIVKLGAFQVSGANGIVASDDSVVFITYPVIFNACSSRHIHFTRSAVCYIETNYTIAGGATFHIQVQTRGALFVFGTPVITVTGAPAFGSAFIRVDDLAVSSWPTATTFSGGATGSRYNVRTNGVLSTGGGGTSFFPGSTAGSVVTGGQYA